MNHNCVLVITKMSKKLIQISMISNVKKFNLGKMIIIINKYNTKKNKITINFLIDLKKYKEVTVNKLNNQQF